MVAPAPLFCFFRALGRSRPSAVQCLTRSYTIASPRAAVQPREDRNLAASRTAPETYPPHSMTSPPRPKESRASRRTSHPPKQRHYPTRIPSHHQVQQSTLIPQPIEKLATELCAPNLPYFVTRSANNELPIYTLRKRGGNLKMTRIKRIDGNRALLRDELRRLLGVHEQDAIVNSVTGHVMIKGHWKGQIERFLRERRF